MLGKRIINTATESGAACTTDTVQILDGVPFQSIATYQLDGNANDLTTNYNGTASNVTYSTGKFGQAASFDGSTRYISTSIPNNDIESLSFWMYFESGVTAGRPLGSTVSSSGGNLAIEVGTGGNISCQLQNLGTSAPNGALGSTGWKHIYYDTSRNLYINGVLQSTTNFTDSKPASNLLIGSLRTTYGFFNSKVDQVRVYDRVLSADNVATLYAETAATASTNITLEVPSRVAYYKMSDATDETGSYDGTPSNVNFNVAGKFGNAGEFNGTSSKINTGYIQTGQIYSASFWGKGFSSSGSILRDTPAAGGANTFMDIATGANGQPVLAGNAALDPLNTPSADWTHYVFVLDGTNATIYENGSQTATRTYTAKTGNNGTPVHIMSNGAYPAGFGIGSIDQIRIFDRAITANEVETLYNEVYCQPTIVPTDHFNTVIWDGEAGNGSRDFSGVGFQPDLVWAKRKSSGDDHHIYDSVRGAGSTKVLASNKTAAEPANNAATYGYLDAFLPDGFSTVSGSANNAFFNENNQSFVAWNWKAGGAAVSNTDGTITSQVSANTDAGFSVVKYTGTNSADDVAHGLSYTPELVIAKTLDSSDSNSNWIVASTLLSGQRGILNGTQSFASSTTHFRADATDTVLRLSDNASSNVNRNGQEHIAYCFHSVDGMSRIGSYVGTGASGNSIVTGFRPAFVMVKLASAIDGQWVMYDSARNTSNPITKKLAANSSVAENDSGILGGDSSHQVNFLSNGFELLQVGASVNTNKSGETYIFMAFAEENVQPQPVLANSFNTVTWSGNGSTQAINTVGFQPDLVWIKGRSDAEGARLFDSIRGANQALFSNASGAESNVSNELTAIDNNGFTLGSSENVNQSGQTYVSWNWKASNESTINQDGSISSIVSSNPAAGFSVVKYTGNNTNGATVGHGLSSTPEMFMVKRLEAAEDWAVYHKYADATAPEDYVLILNTTAAASDNNLRWNDTAPTSLAFSLGTSAAVNGSSEDYIAYCFHSIDGYQSVGSYTGNGGANSISGLGFTPRFVLFKCSSTTGAWIILDSVRGSSVYLTAESSAAEASTWFNFSFDSDGWSVNTNNNNVNGSGQTYIYLAIKAN